MVEFANLMGWILLVGGAMLMVSAVLFEEDDRRMRSCGWKPHGEDPCGSAVALVLALGALCFGIGLVMTRLVK